eukprot:m.47118 g.47118  ORF g.47118 m.47118 type:complete len:396 (+) comp47516_c0_seq4:219-1406(+)
MYNCELFVRLFRLACGFLPPTKLQQYALYVAARAGRAEMLAHLLGERHFRTKRVLNKLDERNNETALQAAVQSGDLESVRILLEAGADTLVKAKHKRTVLHYAARSGSSEILDMLLSKAGVMDLIDARDANGTTPMMEAVMHGRLACLQRFLEVGADPSIKSFQDEQNVLHAAVSLGSPSMTTMLLKYCPLAVLDVEDKKGDTPLMCAIRAKNPYFRTRSAPEMPDADPLLQRLLAIIKMLLEHGGSIRLHNQRWWVMHLIDQYAWMEAGDLLRDHEKYLATLGAHTKPALRTPVAESVEFEPAIEPFVGVNLLEMDQQLAEAFNQSEVELATEIQEVEATASTTASTAASTAASTTESVWRTDVVEGEWSQAAVLHIDFSDLEAELEALSSDQQ